MMSNARTVAMLGGLLAVLASTPGCLVKHVTVARRSSPAGASKALITVSRNDLVDRVRRQYTLVKSFNATVDLTPATGSVYKGEITEYKDIRAYILYRQPEDIRIIGLAPVVRTKIFDMVSTGTHFKISIPPKNRFVEGRNDAPPSSKSSLENLRPEAFLRAMLIPPPLSSGDIPFLIDATDQQDALYVLIVAGRSSVGDPTVKKTVFFERTTLTAVRQIEYDAEGDILSDTRYKNWKNFGGGTSFPTSIDISRPKDGYGVLMNIIKLEMNPGITDDKFALEKPEGSQVQIIGTASSK